MYIPGTFFTKILRYLGRIITLKRRRSGRDRANDSTSSSVADAFHTACWGRSCSYRRARSTCAPGSWRRTGRRQCWMHRPRFLLLRLLLLLAILAESPHLVLLIGLWFRSLRWSPFLALAAIFGPCFICLRLDGQANPVKRRLSGRDPRISLVVGFVVLSMLGAEPKACCSKPTTG